MAQLHGLRCGERAVEEILFEHPARLSERGLGRDASLVALGIVAFRRALERRQQARGSDDDEFCDAIALTQREAQRDAARLGMAHDVRAVETEPIEEKRHERRAESDRMVLRVVAQAEAGKVGRDGAKAARREVAEVRCPHVGGRSEGRTVQQKDGGPAAFLEMAHA